jgi:hypothetical protein
VNSNNYVKVSVAAGNCLPEELVASSVRGPDPLSDSIVKAISTAKAELEAESPHSGGANSGRIWSWVFPFHAGDKDSIEFAMLQASRVESELLMRRFPTRRSVYRAVQGLELPSVVQ